MQQGDEGLQEERRKAREEAQQAARQEAAQAPPVRERGGSKREREGTPLAERVRQAARPSGGSARASKRARGGQVGDGASSKRAKTL